MRSATIHRLPVQHRRPWLDYEPMRHPEPVIRSARLWRLVGLLLCAGSAAASLLAIVTAARWGLHLAGWL